MICYYELLGIQRNASQNDIKKAYRKMALIHHPDKNPDRSEEATAYFAQIQEAHEVLSDERERQWYDIHREDLLRGPIDLSQKGVSEFMSTDDLLQFYSRTAFKLFDDNDNGFYSIYRALFIKIDNEEEKALQVDGDSLVDERVDRVFSFGTSNTSYDPDLIEFYNRFLTFSSVKSFRWFDEFRVMDFGDRKLRRLAEQKNKKLRDTARKQFNESVRNLASYIRKRDPRYKKYQSDILENAQRVKDEMKARLIEQQKEKEESAKNYQEQDWSKLDDSYGSDDLVDDCYNDFECVACDKVFKNERQMTTHTQSVKHLERVRLLKAEMEKDLLTMADPLNEDLDSQTFGVNELNETLDNIATEDTLAECAVCEKVFDTMQQLTAHNQSKKHRNQLRANLTKSTKDMLQERRTKPPVEPSKEIEAKIPEPFPHNSAQEDSSDHKSVSSLSNNTEKSERRKVKLSNHPHLCNVCREGFPSRTKLFNHIKDTGHALAVPKPKGKRKDR